MDTHGVAIEVSDQAGPVTKLAVAGQHLVIGRSAEAQIRLDRSTVSRRHAELFCDPFHRWWVRDLGSRNGTLVNGQSVTDQVVRVGDVIGIGEFLLRVTGLSSHAPSAEPPPEQLSSKTVTVSEGTGQITSLQEHTPPKIASSHLSVLNEFGQRLLTLTDIQERLKELCRLMVRDEFRGRCAMVLRVDRGDHQGSPRIISGPESNARWQGWTPYVSRSLLRSLAEKEEPLLASNTPSPEESYRPELSISPDVMAVAAVACPVRSDPTSIDVLYVIVPPECGTSEWLALASLATNQYQQAGLVLAAREHAAVERELDKAREIQTRLVPRDVRIPGLDLAISFHPCRWVGGDYVDVVAAPDGRWLLVLADVCGKGLAAALVASSLHTTIRVAARVGLPLPQLMQHLNSHLLEAFYQQSFVTMVCVLIDPKTGDVECVNAGHPPALLIDAAGNQRSLQCAANLPLGIAEEILECERQRIAPGEVLVLYSDGITDLADMRGERFGTQRFKEHLSALTASHDYSDCAEFTRRLDGLLDAFQTSALPQDDRTFLVAKRPA